MVEVDWSQLITALLGSSLISSIIVAVVNHFLSKRFNEKN